MGERADTENLPALAVLGHVPKVHAGRFQRVVVLHPEVGRPGDTVGFEVERPLIAVRMAGHRETALDAQIVVVPGSPAAAVDEDGRRAAALVVMLFGRGDFETGHPAQRDKEHREQPFLAQALVTGVFHDPDFRIQERGVARAGHHPGLHVLPAGLPVGVRETVAVFRRGGGEADEVGGGEEVGREMPGRAGHDGHVVVMACSDRPFLREGAFYGRLQHDLEGRPVAPVVVSFRITATFVGLIGQLVGFQGLLQHRPAKLRILLPDGEGPVHHPCIAHGVPVDFAPVEPRVGLIRGRLEALVDDGLSDRLPFALRHLSVQPVIADGEGHRHLTYIQEVGRVPVVKRACGEHLVDGAPGISFSAVRPVGVPQPENAFQRLPGGVQQPSADHLPRHGRFVQHRVAECDDDAVGLGETASGGDGRLFPLRHQQPRVRPRLGNLRKGCCTEQDEGQ